MDGDPSRGGIGSAGPVARMALWIAILGLLGLPGCLGPSAGSGIDPMRYRLTGSGERWDVAGEDRLLEDLLPRYPDFFAVVLDPERTDDPPMLAVRDDLEKVPVDRANYDALNAVAIAYYEVNRRGEQAREFGDMEFVRQGYRAAKIVAIPWRAYMEIQDPQLRDAILDFFEDVSTGTKSDSQRTRGRLARIVESLIAKEPDPGRRRRIEELTRILEASVSPLPRAWDDEER